MSNMDDKLVFAEEPEQPDGADVSGSGSSPWTVLIVDDDKEIHSVTQLALSGLKLDTKPLAFLHAYSASEALELMQSHNDIAMVLLDVVMETDDAGLRVAKAIREDLGNDEVRIVLRTGQPGYAPEERVILQYDINDYKTKTDLTRAKLLTTVVSALRSYQQIRTINENRRGLEKIVNAAANLMERHSIYNFSEGVVTQLASLLGLKPEGLLCVRQLEQDSEILILGAAGHFAQGIEKPLQAIENPFILSAVQQCLESKAHVFLEQASVFYIETKNGQAAAFIETSAELSDVNQKLIQLFLANIAVGFENVKLFEELRTAAYRDSLTGLANRAEFVRQIDRVLESKDEVVIAISDINHFSDVNDALGQDVGNKLIQAVGERLFHHFGEATVVARISADVFGILGPPESLDPAAVAEAFVEPFTVEDHRIPVLMTTGFSRRHQAQNGLDGIKQAYIALKNAKNHRINATAVYHPSMQKETQRRLDLVRNLRSDFNQRKLELWFQPQMELQTGRLVGVEALLRWPQEDGSFVSPDIFIPLAEYSGLILDIGHWVLHEACRAMATLAPEVENAFRMAVNVSIPQFRQKNFASQVADVLQQYQVPADRLEIEITESIVMDDLNLVADILRQLKGQGVRIAIDDFGVGFSSLSYVQQLPLDKLKIDRAFVRSAHTHSGAVIIETIINMGHRLGLQTLAEGIETEQQASFFRQLQVQQAQGYLYAKAMRLEQLKDFIYTQSATI